MAELFDVARSRTPPSTPGQRIHAFTWATLHESRLVRPGDTYTVAGVYRRRTWWQWLTRQPRQLCEFVYLPREKE